MIGSITNLDGWKAVAPVQLLFLLLRQIIINVPLIFNCTTQIKIYKVELILKLKYKLKKIQKEKKEKDGRIYLNVPFEEKEEAKKLGAKWDPSRKLWYIPKDMVFERSIDVRQLLHSWYEEPPVKAEPLKIPTNASNFLLKKLKNLLIVASALYDEKSQNKILYL